MKNIYFYYFSHLKSRNSIERFDGVIEVAFKIDSAEKYEQLKQLLADHWQIPVERLMIENINLLHSE